MSCDRWTRRLGTMTLALALTAGVAPTPARAQDPAEMGAEGEGGDKSGRPLDGYLATLCLAGMVLFAVGKSARR